MTCFSAVWDPAAACILRHAAPPECGEFAARLNAAHFKLLQQRDRTHQVKHNQVY
jgi:hypothetical protein